MYSVSGAKKLNKFFVLNDAMSVQAGAISGGFVGGNLDSVSASKITGLTVLGSTDSVMASSISNSFFADYDGPAIDTDIVKVRNTVGLTLV